ncbi:Nuclear envelope morphology protein 1 [Penicillium oxalicum]|uniref:Nuclear envelope morphology protein 1 n=1 Tax=Penicillium oxalicum TaxID=69781 RepID=UPI0020B6FA92|nr:Nuclear envelope morphology protein 1 [Penicillium oxalicum]KAI2790496.1 Nuclear envelope morphology protein 1 [Penicillium oxalicum]
MNSLNILSSRVIGQSTSSSRPRSQSQSEKRRRAAPGDFDFSKHRSYSENNFRSGSVASDQSYNHAAPYVGDDASDDTNQDFGEKTPLMNGAQTDDVVTSKSSWRLLTKRIVDAMTETLQWILSTLAAPGIFVAQFFRDNDGRFSLFAPVRWIWRRPVGTRERPIKEASRIQTRRRSGSTRQVKSQVSRDSIHSNTSDSEGDHGSTGGGTGRKKARSVKGQAPGVDGTQDEPTPRRSIRIKLHNEEALKKQRQHRRNQSTDSGEPLPEGASRVQGSVNLDSLKSPTSPSVHRITNSNLPQKTLVLDLDETLIHSLAKGGRMSSGHMVEVKLSMPVSTALTPGGPQTTLGPQHPILYYVHKRPHCDDFLRKISRWYKLVVFTASVQEYADPVIDWLEQERKYFQARYYRQHCTFRNGAYIKDLSSVEPDLSKVMILDNSPMSYLFHEDNAIPIEGWINDPTDNGLLHLVPMLEALQYVTDVRALLALRRGETET